MADFNFTDDGFWVRLLPNNGQAVTAYNQLCGVYADGVVPSVAWPTIRSQLRDAGYSARKGLKKMPKIPDEQLLAELTA